MRFVDLSQTVEDGLVTYPGLPSPIVTTYLSFEDSRAAYEPGTEFQIGRIEMIANTGTYVDAPGHRFRGRPDTAELPLERLANLPIRLVRSHLGDGERAVGPEAFEGLDVAGCAVLVETGWDRHWGTPDYLVPAPFLTAEAATLLVDGGAALVGIDSLNVDDTARHDRPAHTAILRAGMTLVEHLCNLGELPPSGGRFFAVPVKVRGMATFPVRAFAIVDD